MRYLLVILLSVSLYSPDIIRLVAYADYMIDTVTENKVNICDCEDLIEPSNEGAHKEHANINTEILKYILNEAPWLNHPQPLMRTYSCPVPAERPVNQPYDIFQPPRV